MVGDSEQCLLSSPLENGDMENWAQPQVHSVNSLATSMSGKKYLSEDVARGHILDCFGETGACIDGVNSERSFVCKLSVISFISNFWTQEGPQWPPIHPSWDIY